MALIEPFAPAAGGETASFAYNLLTAKP